MHDVNTSPNPNITWHTAGTQLVTCGCSRLRALRPYPDLTQCECGRIHAERSADQAYASERDRF
jgi:hypothetical protein